MDKDVFMHFWNTSNNYHAAKWNQKSGCNTSNDYQSVFQRSKEKGKQKRLILAL